MRTIIRAWKKRWPVYQVGGGGGSDGHWAGALVATYLAVPRVDAGRNDSIV